MLHLQAEAMEAVETAASGRDCAGETTNAETTDGRKQASMKRKADELQGRHDGAKQRLVLVYGAAGE